jgi:hypothetical protein
MSSKMTKLAVLGVALVALAVTATQAQACCRPVYVNYCHTPCQTYCPAPCYTYCPTPVVHYCPKPVCVVCQPTYVYKTVCYTKCITAYETHCEPYTKVFTTQDNCGCCHTCTKTCYREVTVPVKRLVTCTKRIRVLCNNYNQNNHNQNTTN